jgi:uncharacterized protein with HEPN domain
MKRTYTDYLRDILDAAEKAEQFLSDVSEEQFKANDEKVFAVVRALEIVGEAARAIPDDVRTRYPAVPWRDVAGMRDKLVHAYFVVDLKRVWETVKRDLPTLRESVTRMLVEAEEQSKKQGDES